METRQNSKQEKPARKAKTGLLQSRFFAIGIIGVGVAVLAIVLGLIFSNIGGSEENKAITLKIHLSATEECIKEYQPDVKSSSLHSDSASLYNTLRNIDSRLTKHLEKEYNHKGKDIEKNFAEKIESNKNALNSSLLEAKNNNTLDKVYAQKMANEVSIFLNELSKIISSTKSEDLKKSLDSSYENLKKLQDSFNNFSETEQK